MAPLELTWLACDFKSGRIAEELRSLRPTQAIGRRLGQAVSTTFELDLAGAPTEWASATDPGRILLVAVDRSTGLPVWSGPGLVRAGGSASTLKLSAVTPEGYLDRRYAAGYTAAGVDMATAMANVASVVTSNGPALAFDTTVFGTTVDMAIQDGDDKTVLAVLTELAGMTPAPEFTIDTVWADAAQTTVQLVLRIHPTIGVQSAVPEAQFDMPGCVIDYELSESYETGKGATVILAKGEGEGTTRSISGPQTATALMAAGWPEYDFRFTPATNVLSVAQLNAHAARALELMATGTKAWTVNAAASAAPRLGTEWGLGDSIALNVAAGVSPRHPAGVATVARAYGWELDPAANRLSPILLET